MTSLNRCRAVVALGLVAVSSMAFMATAGCGDLSGLLDGLLGDLFGDPNSCDPNSDDSLFCDGDPNDPNDPNEA